MKVRKADVTDCKGIAKVHVDSWRTTYKGIVSDEYLNNLNYEQRIQMWTRFFEQDDVNSCLFVAENEAREIVGFANGGKERTGKFGYEGELYAIYILQDYQGKKVGKRLVYEVSKELLKKDFTNMLVWVLADNPSRAFYESLLPEYIAKEQIEIAGKSHEEIAFGWPNLDELNNRTRQ